MRSSQPAGPADLHEVTVEVGGDRFRRRLVSVRSPGGVTVWFEGTNEADA